MSIISIDLAYKKHEDIGISVLSQNPEFIDCTFHPCERQGIPELVALSDHICDLAEQFSARIVVIDGPQAWKHPDNGLKHSRICERLLNTPAKTGLPGHVKPANYRPFVQFSIYLFFELTNRGWHMLNDGDLGRQRKTVLESFPLSAWRSLRIQPLPSKRKHTLEDVGWRTRTLEQQFRLRIPRIPSHDELQALVSGLGGIAFEAGDEKCFQTSGRSPVMLDGTWREGFIVNPQPLDHWPEYL